MEGSDEKNFYSMNLDHWTNQPYHLPYCFIHSNQINIRLNYIFAGQFIMNYRVNLVGCDRFNNYM
jgi:hypothetical protein